MQGVEEYEINKEDEWFSDHRNIVAMGRHLLETMEITTPDDMLDFFEKPHHWTAEWQKWNKELAEQNKQGSLT